MEGSRLELGEPIKDAISRIRFAPRSNNLLISSWDSILRLYDVDGSVLRLEALLEGALLDCCFQNDMAALTAGSDGFIRRYNLCSGTQDVVGKHDDSIVCIEYSEETGQFVTSSLDKKLKFWDTRMRSGNSLCACTIDSDVRSMSLCGVYLLAAIGTTVEMHDLRNLKGPVHTKESSMDFQIRCVRSFPKCHGYVTGSVDGCVAVKYFDPAMECEMGYVFRCHPKSKGGRAHLVDVNDIALHPCYDTFVTGDNEGYTIIWDAQCRKKLFEFPRYPNSVASLSYNYNGQLLAVASSYTYQEAIEVEESPEIFIQELENLAMRSSS
ncbi:mitotic checkpoint protein BUB3.3 [Typha latifolia]|uniref:mitotic checkpoint protein BUB3.3 n=1 Tax=Typha latifolia TaxID=4733 RepID=UPI003C2D7E96